MREKSKWVFLLIIFLLIVTGYGCNRATIGKAKERYDLGEYYEAARIYRKIYNKTKPKERDKRGMLAFEMGNCYRLINYTARAEASYRNAIRYNYPDSMAHFYAGEVLRKNGKYKEAVKLYEAYLNLVPGDKRAMDGLRACEMAPEMKKNPTLYIVKRMDKFNSRRGDFAPMLLPPDGEHLYFTSFRDKVVGEKINAITGTKFNDLFVASINKDRQWDAPESIESEINSEFDDGVCSFTADGKKMYFTRGRMDEEKAAPAEIYVSSRSDASWGAPSKVGIVSDSINSVAHPAVSPDGDYLLFVSDMPGGFGGKDIWKYYLSGREEGVIENMGPIINTPGDEMFPYVRDNGDIYFASDGHVGMGGLDLFKAVKVDGKWVIENMGAPINSNMDDFGITFYAKQEKGFFSSNRGNARGWDHIYSFEYPTFKTEISGIAWDKEDEPVPDVIIHIVGNDGTNVKIMTKPDGSYQFDALPGVFYIMSASKEGYLNAREELETEQKLEDLSYIKDFSMLPIAKPILIENIFYDFDKADLRPESETALNELIRLLNDNPNITIELGSHTDMKGSDQYNLKLSQRRAESVITYLINNGIQTDRLIAKGYGESLPVIVSKKLAEKYTFLQVDSVLNEKYIMTLTPEQQDTACQINRRTEFKVLKTTYNLY